MISRKPKLKDFFEESEKIMSPESIKRAKAKAEKEILKLRLSELRNEAGIKQKEIEGFSQTSISRIESRSDLKISTLIDYIHALGFEIEIKAISKSKTKKKDKEYMLLKS